MRVLLIADDPDLRATLGEAMRRRGWEVIAASDGGSGLEHFRREPFPVVALAIEGAAAWCRCLRTEEHGGAAQLLVVAAGEPPQAAIAAGADDFLSPPLQLAELDARLALAERRVAEASARERAETALRESEERYRRFFEEDISGDFISTPEGRVLACNAAYVRMLGFDSTQEALSFPASTLYPRPERREGFLALLREKKKLVHFELELRRRDGEPVHVLENVIGQFDEHGELVEFWGYLFDITARKRIEDELRRSEQRYRALFDQSPLGVLECDDELRVVHCNRGLLEMLGVSHEQVVGMDLKRLRDPQVLPALTDAIAGRTAFYEGPYLPTLRPDLQLWISVHSAPLRDAQEKVVGAVVIVEDVTERKGTERQLERQTAELERANAELRRRAHEIEEAMRSRNQLYARLNHELRTPLSAIMLFNDLLLGDVLGTLSAEQRAGVERVQDAARHLLALVQDVLDLSKIEAGKIVLHPAPVALAELLEELLGTVRPLAESRGSELRLEGSGPECHLHTDPRRLRQILFNLLSNAIKFGRARPVVLRCRRSLAREVIIEVVDQGDGIAAEDLPHIFEDFVQLGDTRGEGSGLGLAISKRLTHLLGGRLEVESVRGQGSTFRLVLPADPSGASAIPSATT